MNGGAARRVAGPVAFVFLLTAASGCGFVFVDGPPRGHQKLDRFSCTEGSIGPILDAAMAVQGLIALGLSSADDDESFSAASRGSLMATAGVLAVGYGASSVVGFNKVGDCKEAREALEERQSGAEGGGAASDTSGVRIPSRPGS